MILFVDEEQIRGGDEDELSSEESEDDEEKTNQESVTKQVPMKNVEILPRNNNSVPKEKSKVHCDQKDSVGIHLQDTSIVESAKGDYSGTQTQTIRFDQNEVNEPENVPKENNDKEKDKDSPRKVKRTSRRTGSSYSGTSLAGKKTNMGRLRRERTSESTGSKEHEEIREKIRLTGMAVVAHGKLDGPTSVACTIV